MWDRLVDTLIVNGNIKSEDKELYSYGLREGAKLILNIVSCIIVGFLMGMTWQVLVFFIVYSPLRTFAGGAHAKTPFRCYILSIILVVISLVIIKFLPSNEMLLLSLLIFSCSIIFLLSPVEDKNKPLDEIELKIYRKRVLIILVFDIILTVILILLRYYQITACVVVSLIIMAFMLVIGKIKNSIFEKNMYEGV